MPQIRKGGKYVFGYSEIRSNFDVQIPPDTLKEYPVVQENKIIVFSGSKHTGGICVTTHKIMRKSKLNHILVDMPDLDSCELPEGLFKKYKGRYYTWLSVNENGVFTLSQDIIQKQTLSVGDKLMVIRSSDIAFTMGAKGNLLEAAAGHKDKIPIY